MPAMMKRILLVPDTRRCVGFGHISRITTLAEALAGFGLRPMLLVPRDAPPLPSGLGRWTIRRGANPVKAAVRLGSHAVVLDGYGMPARLARPLARRGIRVACIDDMGLPRLPLDLIVNPNAHARHGLYHHGATCRLGPRHALLRQSVVRARDAALARSGANDQPRIFVCMGGADPDGRTLAALDALDRLAAGRPFAVTVVMGPAADTALIERVRERAGRMACAVRVLHAPANFVEELASSDLAVVSGGVVLTECIFLGVAPIALILAENQREGVAAWRRAGVAEIGSDDGDTLAAQIAALLDDPDRRRSMSRRGRNLLDGKGARRVARILLSRRMQGR